jgi:hypothetical protein
MYKKCALFVGALLLAVCYGSRVRATVIPKTDVYLVQTADVTLGTGDFSHSTGGCSSDADQIISGGCYNDAEFATLVQSYPHPTQSTSLQDYWVCEWYNNSTNPFVNVYVETMCITN